VGHKEEYERSDGYGESRRVAVSYVLKNGTALSRTYDIPASAENAYNQDINSLQTLLNSREARLSRKSVSIPIIPENILHSYVSWFDGVDYRDTALSADEAYRLYTACIVPEIESGALGRIWLTMDEDYYSTVYNAQISIELVEATNRDDGYYNHDFFFTVPTTDSVRTNEFLVAKGIYPVLERNAEYDFAG